MSVQELNALHGRYIELSARFKAAWTFHQFLQGLQKVFVEEAGTVGKYPVDFQSAYGSLKEVSSNLTAANAERIQVQLEQVASRLQNLTSTLFAEDGKVSPSLLRMFFQRVKNYDEKILTQMVRFYIYAHESTPWDDDRIDKVDYLITRLAGEISTADHQDRARLREIFASFWSLVQRPAVTEAEGERTRARIEELGLEIGRLGSIDDLDPEGLIARYRELKHELGELLLEPDVLIAVVETNGSFRRAVRQLYEQEERGIFADYQRISDLEREVPVDVQLDQELSQFHREVEQFEARLQEDNLRLGDVVHLRRRMQTLLPRLEERPGERTGAATALVAEIDTVSAEAEAPAAEPGKRVGAALTPTVGRELLQEQLDELLGALEASDPTASPRGVTLSQELFPYRLEPREVVAYRRIAELSDCDQDLERFVLDAAALRQRIASEAQQINSLLDDSAATRDGPLFAAARRTTRAADAYLHQFDHCIHQAILDGDLADARALQIVRVRLMRSYAGLWLLVHRDPGV